MSQPTKFPEELVYPVEKIPAWEVNPGFNTNSYNSHVVVVTTPTGKLKVNDCSKDYQLIRNSALIDPIIDGLAPNHKVLVTGSAWNNAVFSINISVGRALDEKVVVDKLYPMISILNSYNGKIKCTTRLGIMRGVCTNGLMLPESSDIKFLQFSHTPSNEEHIAIGRILEVFGEFLEHAGDIAEVYDDLKVSPVSDVVSRVEEVIENTAFPNKFKEDVIDRINLEMSTFKFKQTDWLVYNGFNYQLNHHEEMVWDPKKRVKVDQDILTYLLEN